jgi:histidinol-phosphate aminotransferase
MPFDIQKLVRPSVLNLKPYASARHDFAGEADVYLDANENSYGSPAEEGLHRYPDPYQDELRTALAKYKKIAASRIFFGNGSDEPIDLLMRAFCRPGLDHIITQPPTYSMYGISAAINDIQVKQLPLHPDFQCDTEILKGQVDSLTRIVFFCSPNNPSGNVMKREAIESILELNQCLVVVDEAYIDFADEPSFIHSLDKFPNLVVLQTFSKAWGLAAARLGVLFANEEVIAVLNKIKPPYNISLLSQQAGVKALQNSDSALAKINKLKSERDKLSMALAKLQGVIHIYPSDANFLLVKFSNADDLYQQLNQQGIIVRNRSKELHCENCLRITIGTEQENDKLIQTLKLSLSANRQ